MKKIDLKREVGSVFLLNNYLFLRSLLLLSCATWEIKNHVRFKVKGYITPEKRGPFYNGKSSISASGDRWQYHPSPQFWYASDRGRNFSPETTPIVTANDRLWNFRILGARNTARIWRVYGGSVPKPDAITTRLPTASQRFNHLIMNDQYLWHSI